MKTYLCFFLSAWCCRITLAELHYQLRNLPLTDGISYLDTTFGCISFFTVIQTGLKNKDLVIFFFLSFGARPQPLYNYSTSANQGLIPQFYETNSVIFADYIRHRSPTSLYFWAKECATEGFEGMFHAAVSSCKVGLVWHPSGWDMACLRAPRKGFGREEPTMQRTWAEFQDL